MAEINISELRSHLPRYVERAAAGEVVLITRHGQVVAQLTAAQDPREAAKHRLAQLRSKAQVGDVVSPVNESWEAER